MKKIISLFLISTIILCMGCNKMNNVADETVNTDIEYAIIEDTEYYNSELVDRGYFTKKISDDVYYITICSGEKSSGGYTISVADIEYKNNVLTIKVEEASPDPMSMVTQAFTYPNCVVSVNKIPGTIKVVDTYGFEFNKIKGV